MSLRTFIQTEIMTAFRDMDFPVVDYDKRTGLPDTTCQSLNPEVVCNEVEGQLMPQAGHKPGYTLNGWLFETLLKFSKEVDVTDNLMEFSLVTVYTNPNDPTDTKLVMISLDSPYAPEHPANDGSHSGTRVKLTLVVNIKK